MLTRNTRFPVSGVPSMPLTRSGMFILEMSWEVDLSTQMTRLAHCYAITPYLHVYIDYIAQTPFWPSHQPDDRVSKSEKNGPGSNRSVFNNEQG